MVRWSALIVLAAASVAPSGIQHPASGSAPQPTLGAVRREEALEEGPALRGVGQDEAPRLLIVAPERFLPALADFVAHKREILRTDVAVLERVLRETDGADDPERLKRYLYDRWRGRGVRYVLLVGDADVMPVRYMVLDRVTAPAFDYAFYPSDLYYADLAKPDGSFEGWNARRDDFHARYFGEVRGEKNKDDPINYDDIDYRADVAVGRWPVSTPEEVAIVAAKTVALEDMVLHGRPPRRAGLVCVDGWFDARDRLARLADGVPGGWTADRLFYGGDPPPDEQHVVALLNEGAAVVAHAGHGSDDSWAGCFSTGSLAQVHNADRLPVMLSAGCSTARFATLPPYEAYVDADGADHAGTNNGEVFDAPPPPPAPYQTGANNPTGLGEQLLRRGPDGAVAYFGCNTGGQPCGVTLVEGFVAAWNEMEEPRLGDCWMRAVAYYWDHEHLAELTPNDDWYPPSIFFQGMKYMLFGDPSLRLVGGLRR